MNYIILFLHHPLASLLLTKMLTKALPQTHIQAIPIDKELIALGKNPEISNEAYERSLFDYLREKSQEIDPAQVTYVIFESNYGKGSQDIFADVLYRNIAMQFPEAQCIAYSSTIGSLELALAHNERLLVCNAREDSDLTGERVIAKADLVAKVKEGFTAPRPSSPSAGRS